MKPLNDSPLGRSLIKLPFRFRLHCGRSRCVERALKTAHVTNDVSPHARTALNR